MPRQLRIEYEGAMYHVMNRGNHGEVIFLDDEDRKKFLATLGETCSKAGWEVHAYCLMDNHFHLVIECPKKFFQLAYVPKGTPHQLEKPFWKKVLTTYMRRGSRWMDCRRQPRRGKPRGSERIPSFPFLNPLLG